MEAQKFEEEEEKHDRLSNLPEALITEILTLVPTKQAARTSILSKRWIYLWHTVTNLDIEQNLLPIPRAESAARKVRKQDWERWKSMMDSVEHSIKGPIQRCKISFKPSDNLFYDYLTCVNSFLSLLSGRGIQELSVVSKGRSRHPLPSQILLCPFLEKLELHWCKFVWFPTPTRVHHSNLKSLTLHKSCFTSYQFQRIISCCKLLESLKVDCCVEVKRLVITGASKLSSLEIITRRRLHIVLEGNNQLRRFSLECLHCLNEYGYDNRPKKFVKFCIDLSHDSNEKISLKFCEMFAEFLLWNTLDLPDSLLSIYNLQRVKNLKLKVSLSNIRVAACLSCLLNSCSNLQELIIQDMEHENTVKHFWENLSPSKCLIHQLKIVQINEVNVCRYYWLGFVKYLLTNACICKRMTIRYCGEVHADRLLELKWLFSKWASTDVVPELESSNL